MSSKKKPNLKLRLVFLYVGSFIVSVLPLIVVLAIRWGRYTETPSETVKLCIGGIICLLLIFLKVVGKLKMPRRIVLFGVVFVMAYLLQALLDDLLLLSGMALIGEFLDFVCFQHAIRITKENILIGKTADATTQQIKEVLKEYVGNGRV